MGHRQLDAQVVAIVALLCGCGSKAPSQSPVESSAVVSEPDREGVQIEAIAAAVNEFSRAVHTCWARAAADDFRVEGRVVLRVDIARPGTGVVTVAEDAISNATLTGCLVDLWGDYPWPESFSEGDAIVLPPFEFVAPDAQYTVSAEHVARHSLADDKLEVRVLLDAKNTGSKAAGMSLLIAQPGLEVPLHTHDSTELLFVLSGEGELDGVGGPRALRAGMGIFVPAGAVHGFRHTGDRPVELLQLYAPGGAEQRFKDPTLAGGTVLHDGPVPRRGRKALVSDVADAIHLPISAGKGSVRILFDEEGTGESSAYMGALVAEPTAVVPLHRHSESAELLFVIEGSAEMMISGKTRYLQPGDAVLIPSGVEHGATVLETTLKAVQFYTPAGPEQRFKEGAEKSQP